MFKLNTAQAKAFDQRGGFINEAGKYVGVIESAIWHTTEKNGGSENVVLNFVSESKQKARFYINTSYHGGTVNEGGAKLINALLACLRMHGSGDPVPTQITEYNHETRQEEAAVRSCFVALHGKPIGIVVQMVHEDGRDNPSASIYSLFEPSTEMTASEILNRAVEPVQLGKVLAYISEKPLNDKRKFAHDVPASPTPPRQQESRQAKPQDDVDDDIPF